MVSGLHKKNGSGMMLIVASKQKRERVSFFVRQLSTSKKKLPHRKKRIEGNRLHLKICPTLPPPLFLVFCIVGRKLSRCFGAIHAATRSASESENFFCFVLWEGSSICYFLFHDRVVMVHGNWELRDMKTKKRERYTKYDPELLPWADESSYPIPDDWLPAALE